MSDTIGNVIRSLANYPGILLVKTKITPNQITFLGLIVNCAVAYLIADGNLSYLYIGILIWVAGFFDALDGSVARITGKTTKFGNFWDSVLDRYSDSIIYFGLMVYYLNLEKISYVLLIVISIIGSLIVSYSRAKAESLDQECKVGLMTRPVRIIVLGACFWINQVFLGLLVIAILSHLTVVQRIIYVYNKLRN
jgi:CDP-diacylglycerol--glycerol-3-phosphate 3-phosphatidyltransferase